MKPVSPSGESAMRLLPSDGHLARRCFDQRADKGSTARRGFRRAVSTSYRELRAHRLRKHAEPACVLVGSNARG